MTDLVFHSERSEESNRTFVAGWRNEPPAGFSASLRITSKVKALTGGKGKGTEPQRTPSLENQIALERRLEISNGARHGRRRRRDHRANRRRRRRRDHRRRRRSRDRRRRRSR